MANVPKIGKAVYQGPSIVKEIIYGIALGLAAGGLWKMHHWNNQRRTREFYDLLEKGEISVVVADEQHSVFILQLFRFKFGYLSILDMEELKMVHGSKVQIWTFFVFLMQDRIYFSYKSSRSRTKRNVLCVVCFIVLSINVVKQWKLQIDVWKCERLVFLLLNVSL